MKKRDVGLFVAIFSLLLLVVGGTYAYWTWNSNTNKNIVFNTSSGIEEYVVYDEGNSYFIGNFQPAMTFCDGASTTIAFYKTSDVADVGLVATINMDVNSIGTYTSTSSDVYWVITSGDNASCSGSLSDALNYGTFNGISSGQTITLLSDIEITTSVKKYTIWIWIDESGSDLSLLSGETVDTNIWTQVDMLDMSQ